MSMPNATTHWRLSLRMVRATRCCFAGRRMDQPVAAGALHAFGGTRLVYIGDSRFTGDAAFHDMLSRNWNLERRLPLPSWPGLEDCARLYKRKQSP